MKRKILIGMLAVLCLFVFAACARQNAMEEPGGAEGIASLAGYMQPPADAGQYRGVVRSIEERDGQTVLVLEQAEGTDFGSAALTAMISDDTQSGVDVSELKQGDYVEVWYGGGLQPEVDAIVVNLLPSAESSVFNGILKELTEESGTSGTMLLEPLGEGEETLFRYDENTSLYLNLPDLQPGDEVNVFFSGAATMSLPPQATAWELRQVYGD